MSRRNGLAGKTRFGIVMVTLILCLGVISAPAQDPDTTFRCGVLDGDGDIVDPSGAPGETVPLLFFYSDPDDNIAGFQVAITYHCDLSFVPGSFTVDDTIVEAVGAEFVTSSVDDDPDDGDPCEFTVAILLDALPPFEGQTVPPTATPLAFGHVLVEIEVGAEPDTALPVDFTDGVNASETVPISNIVVIGALSVPAFPTFPPKCSPYHFAAASVSDTVRCM